VAGQKELLHRAANEKEEKYITNNYGWGGSMADVLPRGEVRMCISAEVNRLRGKKL